MPKLDDAGGSGGSGGGGLQVGSMRGGGEARGRSVGADGSEADETADVRRVSVLEVVEKRKEGRRGGGTPMGEREKGEREAQQGLIVSCSAFSSSNVAM